MNHEPRKPVNQTKLSSPVSGADYGIKVKRIASTKNKKKRIKRPVISGLPHQNEPHSVNQVGYLRKRKKKLTGKQWFFRIGIGLVSTLAVLFLCGALLYNYFFSGLVHPDGNNKVYPTEALTYQPPQSKDITNILLLGVDARNPDNQNGLSDSIIILTVDKKNNVIKMTSIMRDCYVYIPGHKSPQKINAANSYGGPELAMQTINNTLRLNITKYMVVDMFSMMDIVDLAGGVTIDVTKAEMKELNRLLKTPELKSHVAEYGGSVLIENAGVQKLNGIQTVTYARIRKIDSDSERAKRQRTVLKALYTGFLKASAISKAQMIQKGISCITTNMSSKEITSLGLDVLPSMGNEIQEMRLPLEGYYKVNSTGVWYMRVDYNAMIPEVYKFLYGKTQPFDPVPTVPLITSHSGSGTVKATATPKPSSGNVSSGSGTSTSSSQTSTPTGEITGEVTGEITLPVSSEPAVTEPVYSGTVSSSSSSSSSSSPSNSSSVNP